MKFLSSLAVAVLILAAFSLVAVAQQDTSGGSGPAVGQQMEKKMTPEQFSALKSRILKMIEIRQTKLNEEKACIDAATTPAELRKCRPMHHMGPGHTGQKGQAQQPPAGQQQ
jgi:hypothetical protein